MGVVRYLDVEECSLVVVRLTAVEYVINNPLNSIRSNAIAFSLAAFLISFVQACSQYLVLLNPFYNFHIDELINEEETIKAQVDTLKEFRKKPLQRQEFVAFCH